MTSPSSGVSEGAGEKCHWGLSEDLGYDRAASLQRGDTGCVGSDHVDGANNAARFLLARPSDLPEPLSDDTRDSSCIIADIMKEAVMYRVLIGSAILDHPSDRG
jgi:hypothetical protein